MNLKRILVTAGMVIAADMVLERFLPDEDPQDESLVNMNDVALGVTAALLLETFGRKLAR